MAARPYLIQQNEGATHLDFEEWISGNAIVLSPPNILQYALSG
jgi:hypothetical protein